MNEIEKQTKVDTINKLRTQFFKKIPVSNLWSSMRESQDSQCEEREESGHHSLDSEILWETSCW